MNNIKGAKIFKALADENRLLILEILKNGEMCADELLERLSISQPTLSHHMKILCSEGIVLFKKSGRRIYYAISKGGIYDTVNYLVKLSGNNEKTRENVKELPYVNEEDDDTTGNVKEVKSPGSEKNDIWLF